MFQDKVSSRWSRFAFHNAKMNFFPAGSTMSRPNHRAIRTALSTALALALMLMAGAAAAQGCPSNFFDTLESKTATTAAKQDIGTVCKGRDVTFRGTLLDVAKRGDVFELHLASEASGNRITVTMRDPPGADMSQLRKGAVVTIAAKLRDFTGLQNEYVTLEDGSCKDCGR
jgi:hypothetical protein